MTVITHDANISITHDANLTITLQSDIHDVYNIRHDIQNSVIQIILTRLIYRVCTSTLCLYIHHVFVHLPCVCTFITYLYIYPVFVHPSHVCTSTLCLYIHHVFVHLPCVCTSITCLYI